MGRAIAANAQGHAQRVPGAAVVQEVRVVLEPDEPDRLSWMRLMLVNVKMTVATIGPGSGAGSR